MPTNKQQPKVSVRACREHHVWLCDKNNKEPYSKSHFQRLVSKYWKSDAMTMCKWWFIPLLSKWLRDYKKSWPKPKECTKISEAQTETKKKSKSLLTRICTIIGLKQRS